MREKTGEGKGGNGRGGSGDADKEWRPPDLKKDLTEFTAAAADTHLLMVSNLISIIEGKKGSSDVCAGYCSTDLEGLI